LKHLKKNTIKAFFLFARSSGHNKNNDQSDESLPGVLFEPSLSQKGSDSYNEFLDSLTTGERAELTALYHLGCDKIGNMAAWELSIQELTNCESKDLYDANPQRIPQIIRLGLERLARFKKSPHPVTIAVPPTDSPEHDTTTRLAQIAGQFTVDAYQEKYGDLEGMKRLLTILDIKRYLEKPDDRNLLGLPPKSTRMPLETLHLGKKSPLDR